MTIPEYAWEHLMNSVTLHAVRREAVAQQKKCKARNIHTPCLAESPK